MEDLVNISIPTAAGTALLGYLVVFFGLVLLMVVLLVMGSIFTRKKAKAEAAAAIPAPIDPEVRAKILGDEKPIQGRYADSLPTDTFEKAAAELGDTARCEEDVLSYIAFPPVAEKFFAKRREEEEKRCAYSIVAVEE